MKSIEGCEKNGRFDTLANSLKSFQALFFSLQLNQCSFYRLCSAHSSSNGLKRRSYLIVSQTDSAHPFMESVYILFLYELHLKISFEYVSSILKANKKSRFFKKPFEMLTNPWQRSSPYSI